MPSVKVDRRMKLSFRPLTTEPLPPSNWPSWSPTSHRHAPPALGKAKAEANRIKCTNTQIRGHEPFVFCSG